MPEIKTKHKSQPVLNTAQQQMQRSFVRSRAEQTVHRQSERSESPSDYAEKKSLPDGRGCRSGCRVIIAT